MFGIPFLLKYLFDTFGLYGATLLSSCLWLSVCLAASLFGKGVTKINENLDENFDIERNLQSNLSASPLIFSRRASLLPSPTHFHFQQQNPSYLSTIDDEICPSEHLVIVTSQNDEKTSSKRSDNKSFSLDSIHSSPLIIKTISIVSSTRSNHQEKRPDESILPQIVDINEKTNFYREIFVETCWLFRVKTFVLLIFSMIFIWSFDETNFLFLSDLLKSTGHSEERSTLLIAITGIADLVGQLFFGYFRNNNKIQEK